MKRLLLSTAMLGAVAMPAAAQDETIFREAPDAMEIRASDFMGMRVYTSEAALEGEEFEGVQEGWEDVGEIGDIIMDRDGTVQAVLVDIGGFLGIGERTVAVSMDALRFVSDSATAEEMNDFFLVMNANREALEAAPEYVAVQQEGMTAEEAATETDEVIEEGASDVAEAGAAVGSAVEEAGDEVAEAGAEVADEAADAGEEVTEEVAQTEMTDLEEDSVEVADEAADATEEATEESAEVAEETVEEVEVTTIESEPQTEVVTEETEAEMATEETAEAAVADEGETTTADTQDEVIVSNVPAEEGEAVEEPTEEVAEGELVVEEEVAEETADAEARIPLEREGFVAAGVEDFTADRLQGAPVYDANDERVGEVGEILLSEDGQVSELVVDVGGFLGLGEKPVALPMDSLDILRQDGGEEIRVYVSQTEEELEAMERFEAE